MTTMAQGGYVPGAPVTIASYQHADHRALTTYCGPECDRILRATEVHARGAEFMRALNAGRSLMGNDDDPD